LLVSHAPPQPAAADTKQFAHETHEKTRKFKETTLRGMVRPLYLGAFVMQLVLVSGIRLRSSQVFVLFVGRSLRPLHRREQPRFPETFELSVASEAALGHRRSVPVALFFPSETY
jgi:hypothetical protein